MRVEELNNTNCKSYLLTVGEQAALVDPVRDRFDTYRAVLAARGLRLQMILETHMHADHLMMSHAQHRAFGVPLAMHTQSSSPRVDRHLRDGEVLMLGDEPIEVLYTPGHTTDSVCYRLPHGVLTGDTLMIGGSGRCDFPGGDAGLQYDAVTRRLFTMPDETIVYPGHDYKGFTTSTIGAERETNPRFLGRTRDEYIAVMGALGLPFPEKIQQSLQVNQSGFEASELGGEGFAQVADVATLPEVPAADVFARLRRSPPPLLLDVREPEEFVGELGHIEGSILVPMDALARRLPKLAGYVEREIIVVCRAGARSASAGAILRAAGFRNVANLANGMLGWCSAGLPVMR